MLVRYAAQQEIQQAAEAVGVNLLELKQQGTAYRFRLGPVRGKYQRTSASYFTRGRKVHAVCWHGHRDFFRELFRLVPDAVVITGMARYDGREDFELKDEATADVEVDPSISPITYGECCVCQSS